MNNPVLVRNVMVTNPFTVFSDTKIVVATRALLQQRYSGLPVIEGDRRLVGVLSKRDCMEAALNAHYHRDWSGKVSDYMTREVETLDPETELTAAALHFIYSRYRRFPVTENGLLIGQISRTNVLQALYSETDNTL